VLPPWIGTSDIPSFHLKNESSNNGASFAARNFQVFIAVSVLEKNINVMAKL